MLKQLLTIFFTFLTLSSLEGFDKVVIWGHKLHSHTHSYIHNAFYIAFNHLGYDTYWFDNSDSVEDFDFAHALFVTEGQVDANIPIRDDCQYMIHNCDLKKYLCLKKENYISFQVYTDDVLSRPNLTKVDTCIYYDLLNKCVYMPWATDLLPHEIETIKSQLSLEPVTNKVYWIGTIGGGFFGNVEQINPFVKACQESKIDFVHLRNINVEDTLKFVSDSYMAPTIVGAWQADKGYIPCRIFKNISYGKLGLTNSYRVYELLDKKIVYNPDTYQLFYDAQQKMAHLTLEDMYELMDLVKDKHTYLNRIQLLLDFLDLVHKQFGSQ